MFPIIGALLTPIFAKIHPRLRDFGAIIFGALGMIMALAMLPFIWSGAAWVNTPPFYWYEHSIDWITLPIIGAIQFGVLVDPLSVFMACIATGIGFLILVYSLGYMKGDESLTRYWFLMQLFIGGMTLLVMANTLFVTFLGWEIVGLCSYALIGFWYKRPNIVKDDQLGELTEGKLNSHSGMKAFIVTRIGDVGLLISIIFILFFTVSAGTPTLNYQVLLSDFNWLFNMAAVLNGFLLLGVFLLFFLGPVGKSAQFPLQFWLPEAMAGPTTVSALIHAAAMVKAGVYLVARMAPILVSGYFAASATIAAVVLNNFFLIIAIIGMFTSFMTATMALTSNELKKVLAFSTISQLGYMFMALGIFAFTADGVLGYTAGVFHLAAHAVFKALLFLSAGAVLHAVHSKYLTDMGGLRKLMPITWLVMLIGVLSLGGFPFVGAFWSKELILTSAYELVLAGSLWGWIFLFFGALTAVMTIFYAFRMFGLTFHGEPSQNVQHLEKEDTPAHDPPMVMWLPLAILAIGTLVVGLLEPVFKQFFYSYWDVQYSLIPQPPHLGTLLEEYVHMFQHLIGSPMFYMSLLIVLVGGLLGYMFYIRRSWSPDFVGRGVFGGVYKFFYKRWYWNALMYKVFVDGTLWFTRGLFNNVEVKGIDGANYAIADGSVSLSRWWRRIQTGVHSWNMILLLIGALTLIILLLLFQFLGGVLLIPIPFLP
ncbi:MAG: NADH-quinone oxidoreductase subunit 5 family protein [Candidatus Hermodarchaeia archaeon]